MTDKPNPGSPEAANELTEEVAASLAEWLLKGYQINDIFPPGNNLNRVGIQMPAVRSFGSSIDLLTWLQTPDGLHAVETAMIETGFSCTITFDNVGPPRGGYIVGFYKLDDFYSHFEQPYFKDKAAAILMAAYKAMERDNGKTHD